MMRDIQTQIEINASAERVWELLTDFSRYPEWNPFITKIEGAPAEGERLRVHIQPPGTSGMTLRPKVTRVMAGQELRWLGHLFVPGPFDGEHVFRIDKQAGTTLFSQSERFSGLLVSFLGNRLFEATERGFHAMNAALKARAEK
jgi:hypothetical protein